ncbi:RDD family protein [Solimonas sp. K1W22B-7]|uniref:RDD family protein n=1 Tax=Solimonas sp. K1W22B-7 TaxID=2303331 RepID=UPI000E3313A7|nr:RDD family protein [Solimonas sp. K1W22B-7]AXQ27192.1 RDD family protein [Solimonas sp. K1W22B-7]
MTADPSSEAPRIAGFWRRVGAFFVDGLLLGAVGLVLGLGLAPQLAELGPWGRLLGFSIAMLYFVPLDSRLSGGQTPGKRLLKIRVVTRDGSPLSLSLSLLRFLPLGVPWFLNNLQLPQEIMFSGWGYLLTIIIFGVGLSSGYLLVFNRRTRQGLHDLLAGSYVVMAGPSAPLEVARPWALHLVVCAVLIVASGVLPYFTMRLANDEPFVGILKVQQAVLAQAGVRHAQVTKGKSWFSNGSSQQETRFMDMVVYVRDSDVENPERAKRLAVLGLATDPSAAALDSIRVTIVHGYDIGIAASWKSQAYAHSPAEWRAP